MTTMRVLLISWEYPPLIYGGLGRHVHGLAEALAAQGHDVVVLTQAHPQAAPDARVNGVRVVRVAPDPPARDLATDLVAWVLGLNTALARTGRAVVAGWRPDLVHVHDWVVAHAGVDLAETIGVPLVATIHATEAGLWDGWLSTPVSRARHDVEAWLVTRTARTIVCSAAMQVEVGTALEVPLGELTLIPNGVDLSAWRSAPATAAAARATLGIAPAAPLIVLAGRLEWEKGGDVAIEALPRVRRQHPGTVLVLAGVGSRREALAALARRRRVARSVRFCGHLDEHGLAGLLGAADVAVVPSSYEPFGMVALEASAAGAPVVAGATGGLRELVTDEVSGLLVAPRSVTELSTAVVRLLDDPEWARTLADVARAEVAKRFTWPIVAGDTVSAYTAAVADPRPPRPRPAPAAEGNVLDSRPASVRARWRDVRDGFGRR